MEIRELKALIARNKVRKALDIVLQSECWRGDEALFDEWVYLSQRYHELKAQEKNKTWNPADLDYRRNMIVKSLLEFLNKLPEGIQFRKATPAFGEQAQVWTVSMGFEGLNYQYIENLKKQTSDLLKISPEYIRITGVQEGSLIFQVVLPAPAAFDFKRKFEKGNQSTFFKQLRITFIRHRFPSLASCFYFCGYWLRYGINHRRVLIPFISLLALSSVIYGTWSRFQKAENTPMQKLFFINNNFQKESAELSEIVTQALSLTEEGNRELTIIIEADSLGKEPSYSTLRAIVEKIDQKAAELEEKVKAVNEVAAQFETVTEENIRILPKTPQSAAGVERIRRDQQAHKEQLQYMNMNVTLFKGGTKVLLIAIQLIEDKTGNKELEALKVASMAVIENFEKIEELKMF